MNKSANISLRIVALFVMAMIVSFIPDYLHTFFGDVYCVGNLETPFCPSAYSKFNYLHGSEWHWAYRHWLFAAMGFWLAVVQIVNLVNVASETKIKN